MISSRNPSTSVRSYPCSAFLKLLCWMSTGVIFSIAYCTLTLLRSVRHEVEAAVGHHRLTQPGRIDHNASRHDQVNGFGQLLNSSVDRVRNPGSKIDDALQQHPVGVLKVNDNDLAIAQRVGDLDDVLITARRVDAHFRTAPPDRVRERYDAGITCVVLLVCLV